MFASNRGAKGKKGDTGDTGQQGIQGEQGIQGDTGAQGEPGVRGVPTSGCLVKLSSAQNLPSGETFYTVEFDTEIFDINNEFNTNTHRFTPTTAGYYAVMLNLVAYALGGASGYIEGKIVKNAEEYQSMSGVSGGYVGIEPCIVLYLNGTGDYIEIKVKSGEANKNIFTASYLCIVQI